MGNKTSWSKIVAAERELPKGDLNGWEKTKAIDSLMGLFQWHLSELFSHLFSELSSVIKKQTKDVPLNEEKRPDDDRD